MDSSTRRLGGEEERAKAVVLTYYDKLCRQWDFEAASAHIGPGFRQHSPGMADGIDGLKHWVDNRPPFTAHMVTTTHRVLVDGNFVVLHNTVKLPGQPAMVIVDMFRVEDGKVVEHWDVLQPEPAESLHDNGMV